MNEEQFYSKKDQRIMSAFIGQGLLYDYLTDALDPERRRAVEDYIRSSPEAQMDIQKIQNGLNYATNLQKTLISAELLDKVTVSSSYTQTLLDKIRFDSWPPALKMGIEGTIVALGIATFAIVIPWHKVMDLKFGPRDVILAEVDKAQTTTVVAETDTTSKEGVTFPDEGPAAPVNAVATVTTTTLLKGETPVAVKTPTVATIAPTIPPKTVAQPAKPVAATKPPEADMTPSAEKNPVAGNSSEKKAGVLFRGNVYVTNVQAVTPKLVEKVMELGGRKAGQVELGWFKADSSYFHFTMPESRYQELQQFFQQYGTMSVQQEAHERVMPEGIRRIIITVYEKK
jgi:hypothetical protein